MIKTEFQRIAIGDWEQSAQGTIIGNGIYLEIHTENQSILNFLFLLRTSGEIIAKLVVWVGESYFVYTGDYQVIHMDNEGVVLRKTKN